MREIAKKSHKMTEKEVEKIAQGHLDEIFCGHHKHKGKYLTQSTRKNPDKYIEQLKRDLEWERTTKYRMQQTINKLRGRYWFTPNKSAKFTTSLQDCMMGSARLNQIVVVQGRITAYEQSSGSHPHEVTISLTGVFLKETP